MRVLGIETSSQRGSVALIEHGALIAAQCRQAPTTRAETTLELVDTLLDQHGWDRGSLQRVAVGVGPGSFTGLRVGIALAQGIAVGLDLPLVGLNSLQIMALGASAAEPRIRCALVDARRDELFVAAYDRENTEIIAPRVTARATILDFLKQHLDADFVLLGAVAREIGSPGSWLEGEYTDFPHAACAARAAEGLTPTGADVVPLYLRDADAQLPCLPASPLDLPRTP